jgi:hypothetical protein
MPGDFAFERRGRSARVIALLAGVYAVLTGLVVLVDAAGWLMLLLALPTLPALWDILQDNRAGLRLTRDQLDWYSGRRQGTLALAEIERMRFETRWDFSVRVTVLLKGDKQVRLPHEATPPHSAFEAALAERGVAVERRHFNVF